MTIDESTPTLRRPGLDEDELARRCAANDAVMEDGRLFSDDLVRILSAPAAARDGR